ncbi:hypothetical protein Avbf_06913 [Armadillidium vulgare]|nr:hypothetical protein Avbf_06913 [Armadillidium vulgare]
MNLVKLWEGTGVWNRKKESFRKSGMNQASIGESIGFQVLTLVNKMERLRGAPLQSGIHTSLTRWHEAIVKVQEKRREEVLNALSQRGNHTTNEQVLMKNTSPVLFSE